MPHNVQVVVEGTLDEAVATRLLRQSGMDVAATHLKRGRSAIEMRVRGYHEASAIAPWFVLADLDADPCPAALLVRCRVPNVDKQFVFRIAVREVESWLLADSENLASVLGVPRARFPLEPDRLVDAKNALVELARRSRLRSIREAIVPVVGALIETGPGYNQTMSAFVRDRWNPITAATTSPSLEKCIAALRDLAARL